MNAAHAHSTEIERPALVGRLLRTRVTDLLRGRISCGAAVTNALDASELPVEIISLIQQVVYGTRLWLKEQVEVAEELVAHFTDGLRGGAATEQLVEAFGEPKQAAKLIRCAKRRNRSRLWHTKIWLGRAVVGLILAYGLLAVYVFAGKPNPSVDYLAMLNAGIPDVPPDQRAWPLYREAFRQLMPWPEWIDARGDVRPGDERWAEVVSYLDSRREALELARQAASLPVLDVQYVFHVPDEDRFLQPNSSDESAASVDPLEIPLLEMRVDYQGPLYRLRDVLECDALRAAMANDGDTALQDVRALVGLAQQMHARPLLISQMYGLGCLHQASATTGRLLADHPQLWSDNELHELAHRLAAADAVFDAKVDAESYCFYDVVQRMYTESGRITDDGIRWYLREIGADRRNSLTDNLIASDDVGHALTPALGLMIASREDITAKWDDLMQRQQAEGRRPLWEMETTVDSELQKMARSSVQTWRYLPVLRLIPSVRLCFEVAGLERCRRDGILVALALELYRRRHGNWPRELEELTPDLLPQVPLDRFTGEPLLYRLVDGQPIVYSRAADRDDDGGRPPTVRGKPDYEEVARYWVPASQVEELRQSGDHDGDWIIWPVPRKDR